MTRLLEQINIQVVHAGTQQPVPNIAVWIHADVPHKNGYTFGPVITNANGIAVFTRTLMDNEIELNLTHFPMDYSCRVNEVTQLRCSTMTSGEVCRFLEGGELWGKYIEEAQISEEDQKRYNSVANALYAPASEVIAIAPDTSAIIDLTLHLKSTE